MSGAVTEVRDGGCLCGAVRYRVKGPPLRVGLCHCGDCRKESGAPFTLFVVWPNEAFSAFGATKNFAGRGFCAACGGRLFDRRETETEIRGGSLDRAPTDLRPTYELWVKRREPWLTPLPGADQYDEDRVPPA